MRGACEGRAKGPMRSSAISKDAKALGLLRRATTTRGGRDHATGLAISIRRSVQRVCKGPFWGAAGWGGAAFSSSSCSGVWLSATGTRCCTATSSPKTSCSAGAGTSNSPTSAWPGQNPSRRRRTLNEVVTLWYRPPRHPAGLHRVLHPDRYVGRGLHLLRDGDGAVPLFPGSTVEEQLHFIFRLLGTPTEETWPGIGANAEFRAHKYPPYPPEGLLHHAPRLDHDGADLLGQLLQFEGRRRLPAAEAMAHPFFACLGPRVTTLPDTTSIFALKEIQLQKEPGLRSASLPPPWSAPPNLGTLPPNLGTPSQVPPPFGCSTLNSDAGQPMDCCCDPPPHLGHPKSVCVGLPQSWGRTL
ncbi:uncharacterized protein LOC128135971 [Harpia harpyja]|uniref:uncharacterized protein LOC128135971 n=1 Tax=Harpia harpyja TaxID=202280 RepID=UPI0022B1BF66|nr:uncharacterized protein LOC128135971 [Harpia harpyja]